MAKETKINEEIIDQQINDFINNYLVDIYHLQYTEFSFNYNSFDFYLKFKDKLLPDIQIVSQGYVFNKQTILRLNMKDVIVYCEKPYKELESFLIKKLNENSDFNNYRKDIK